MLNNLNPLFTITHLFSTVFRLGPKPAHILAHLWNFRRLLALFLQWIWKDLQIRSSLFQWACWWINHLPAIEISHHRAGSAAAIRSWIRCLWLTSLPKTDSYHAAKICQVSKLVAFLLPCASSGCCEQKNLGFEDVLPWPKLIKLIHFPKESAGFVGPWLDQWQIPNLAACLPMAVLQKSSCPEKELPAPQAEFYRKSSEHGSMAQNAQNGHHLHHMRCVFSVLNCDFSFSSKSHTIQSLEWPVDRKAVHHGHRQSKTCWFQPIPKMYFKTSVLDWRSCFWFWWSQVV